MAASAAAESAVKKLARLPANTICPNCGTQKKFGFSTVCIKYLTFVCNNCKASHQAISHRCKSLTMSSWTEGEVLALKKAGNEKARATWLAKAPPPGQGGRPKEGDHVDVFKAFIVDVYERKRYFDENGTVESTPCMAPPAPANVKATSSPRRRQIIPPTPNNTIGAPSAPAPAVPAVSDLLDFGAFDSAPDPPQPSQTFTAFGDFAASPAPAQPTQSLDAFGDFTSTPAQAPTPSAFPPAPSVPPPAGPPPATSDPFGLQAPRQQPSFDPFTISSSEPSANKPPAMKNVTGLANTPTPAMGMPSMQQSMGNGMMMGGQSPMMGGNQFMTMQKPQMATMNHNPQMAMMMMMNAQQQRQYPQQMMMQQMTNNPINTMPGSNMFQQQQQPWLTTTASQMGNNTAMPMGGSMGGMSSNFGGGSHNNSQGQAKKDPFSDLGL